MIARASKTALTLLDRDLVIGHTLFTGSRPCLLSHLPQKQSLVMIQKGSSGPHSETSASDSYP
jgi:hypothetical protein